MSLRGWFSRQASNERMAAVMNVTAVMFADGKIDPREMQFLAMVCKRVGVKEDELKRALSDPSKVRFTRPEDPDERARQLTDTVFMMLADGRIDQRELDLCTKFAVLLGFQPSVVPKLLHAVVNGIQKGHSRSQLGHDVAAWAAS